MIGSNSVFRKTYQNNFVAFVHDCFTWNEDEQPAAYQNEIISKFNEEERIAVRGPHGLGKTALAAWIVIAFALTSEQEDWKVVTTASAWRQLTKYLWPEIHKWTRRIKWDRIGRPVFKSDRELQTLSIKLATGEAFAVASTDSELIEGAHARKLCYIFDESKAIPDPTWDSAEGAFATGDCKAFAISTPGDRTGRFWEIHRRAQGYESWWTRHVKLDEAIKAGRISEAWVEERRLQWGEESPVFQARCLGEFPEHGEDSLISLAWVEQARERELKEKDVNVAGQDVARFGSDDSIYILRNGPVLKKVLTRHGNDTMQIAGLIKYEDTFTNIDEIGVGSGVVDRLKEQKFKCNGVNVGSKASDSEHFANLRAELYWNLRGRLKDGDIDLSRMSRQDYDRLSGELTNIKYKYNSAGKIQIEAKEDMKKRIEGKSPDMADALMLAFADDLAVEPAGVIAQPGRNAFVRRGLL